VALGVHDAVFSMASRLLIRAKTSWDLQQAPSDRREIASTLLVHIEFIVLVLAA